MVPVVVSLSYFNYALCACIGAFFAIAGWINLGSLASYLVYVRQTAMPVNQFSQQVNFLLAALSGAERIFAVINQPPETDEGVVTLSRVRMEADGSLAECGEHTGLWAWKYPLPDGTSELIPLKGDVRFYDVTFSYVPGHPVLHHISLYAKPGQTIAFVGSTGAGKTTITNLINRFYDIDSGTITYDGIDVRDIRKDDLRRSLSRGAAGYPSLYRHHRGQHPLRPAGAPPMKRYESAARTAGADSFIRRLPLGYDTLLTGDGANLSQGQRQLLAIARAAIAQPAGAHPG